MLIKGREIEKKGRTKAIKIKSRNKEEGKKQISWNERKEQIYRCVEEEEEDKNKEGFRIRKEI